MIQGISEFCHELFLRAEQVKEHLSGNSKGLLRNWLPILKWSSASVLPNPLTPSSAMPVAAPSNTALCRPTPGCSSVGCNISWEFQNRNREPIRSVGAWPGKLRISIKSDAIPHLGPDQPICGVLVVQHLHNLSLLQAQCLFRGLSRLRHIVLDSDEHLQGSHGTLLISTATLISLLILLMITFDRVGRDTAGFHRSSRGSEEILGQIGNRMVYFKCSLSPFD